MHDLSSLVTLGVHEDADAIHHMRNFESDVTAGALKAKSQIIGISSAIGRNGWKVDLILARLQPKGTSRLVFAGFVSEVVKFRLLRHVEFLVCPSVCDRFGIPAVEAMSPGKPVLASMTSSFSEVIGEARVFFNPRSCTAERQIHKRTNLTAKGLLGSSRRRMGRRMNMTES